MHGSSSRCSFPSRLYLPITAQGKDCHKEKAVCLCVSLVLLCHLPVLHAPSASQWHGTSSFNHFTLCQALALHSLMQHFVTDARKREDMIALPSSPL